MRRLAFLACLFAPVLHFACVSDDKAPRGNLDSLPGLDASSSDGAVLPAADSAAPDAGPLPVTVNVVKNALPEANVTIVFHDAAGAVIDSAKTDANGRVVRVVPAGSQVTALLGAANAAQIVTVVGVEPGDVLTAIDAPPTAGQPSVTITALPASPPAGTLGFSGIVGPCYGGFSPGALLPDASAPTYQLSDECMNARKFPLLVTARNDGAAEIGFTFKKGNAVAADGGAVSVDLSGGSWSTAIANETLSVTNVPGGLVEGRVAYGEVVDRVNYPSIANLNLAVDGGPPPSTFKGHAGYPDFVQREATVVQSRSSDGVVFGTIATRSAQADGGTTNVDLAQLLPFINGASVDSATPARAIIHWGVSSPFVGDGVIARTDWTVYADGGAFDHRSSWTVVAPPTATSVTLPELPASESAWAPPADASFQYTPVVVLLEASFLANYAALRASAGALPQSTALVNDNGGPIAPPLPVDGTLRMTAISTNNQ